MQSRKMIPRLKMILFLVLSLSILSCDDAESRQQVATLRQMAADTATFADFKEAYSYDANKLNHALFGVCYASPAKYDEVKDFYSTTLTAKGWSSPEEEAVYDSFGLREKKDSRKLIFRKAEYSISITYDPKANSGCHYAISFIWESE